MTLKSFHYRIVSSASSREAPTLLLLHGTGGNEESLLPLGKRLFPEASMLSPRGTVSEHGMPRFFRRLAPGVFDVPDLQQRTHELADWVHQAAIEHQLDPHRIIAVGYSNGANIAASLLLLRPQTLAGAILFHAMIPFEPEEQLPLTNKPIFLSGGREDSMSDPEQTEHLAQILRTAGGQVVVHWEEGGHDLTNNEITAARLWLQTQQWPGSMNPL